MLKLFTISWVKYGDDTRVGVGSSWPHIIDLMNVEHTKENIKVM
jgi:hypothetical protein